MSKLPTAEEVLVKNSVFEKPEISNFNLIIHRDCYIAAQRNIKRAMIEFAKLHVEAALKAASEKGEALVRTNGEWTSSKVTARVNKESILNSYPLEKIK